MLDESHSLMFGSHQTREAPSSCGAPGLSPERLSEVSGYELPYESLSAGRRASILSALCVDTNEAQLYSQGGHSGVLQLAALCAPP